MDVLKTILIGLLSFGILIVTHEFGHYISALLLKIRISEFSIGFGPKLLSKKKNGIIYKLSLLPIGGYVRMPEDLEEESSEGVPFSNASSTAKIITLLAGSLSNLLFGYLLVLFVFIFMNNGQFNFEFSRLFENFINGNSFFWEIIKIILDSFKGLFSGVYGIADLSGPIGITTIIGESLESSIVSYLIIMAFMAINIGIFNLLPIPALDGARALICFIEAVINKRFSVKVQESIHTAGLVILLGLILVITLKDIYGLIKIF